VAENKERHYIDSSDILISCFNYIRSNCSVGGRERERERERERLRESKNKILLLHFIMLKYQEQFLLKSFHFNCITFIFLQFYGGTLQFKIYLKCPK